MSNFIPGVTPVLTSGALVGDEEKAAMHAAVDKGWIAGGEATKEFEKGLGKYTGHKYVLACNSGSSANLIAVATMVESGRWKAGDEILCIAASFPTTINPLLLYGLIPVFVDITLPDYSVNMDELEAAWTPKCTGVMIAHTLGIPYDMGRMASFVKDKGLRVVEDCCDALGSYYDGKHVGWLGDISTTSFFPAHHISTGEGGAVFINDPKLFVTARSVRDWGRSCHCLPGEEAACGKRFEYQLGSLPYGFDHKYTYSTMGFNLKMPEIPAAMGVAQLKRLPEFGQARRDNFNRLHWTLSHLQDKIRLPCATPKSNPSWFGFPILLLERGKRRELQVFLDQHKVGSRLVFGGNLVRQPYMAGKNYRVASTLENTDRIMHDALWLGVYPGITAEQVEYMAEVISTFFGRKA